MRVPGVREVLPEPASRDAAVRPRAAAELRVALAAAAGDLDALGELYEQHHQVVRRFAHRLVGEASAEDLVHDTFLALPRALARYQGTRPLRSFVLGVAANHGRHHVRARARFGLALARMSREPERSVDTAEQLSERKRLAERLRRALDTLSFDHRTTFVLCMLEERTSPEVAEILGIPEATVRTRLHNAKRKLRKVLVREEAP